MHIIFIDMWRRQYHNKVGRVSGRGAHVDAYHKLERFVMKKAQRDRDRALHVHAY
jgi:hypothetical protein